MLKRERTEHAKMIRRIYGDYSGMCRFSDKKITISNDDCSGTITATMSKDNLVLVEWTRG